LKKCDKVRDGQEPEGREAKDDGDVLDFEPIIPIRMDSPPRGVGCMGVILLAVGLSTASILLVIWQDSHDRWCFVSTLFVLFAIYMGRVIPGLVFGGVHLLICTVIAYELWPSARERARGIPYRWRLLTWTAVYLAYTAFLMFVPGGTIQM
jgi:hypothetical protein